MAASVYKMHNQSPFTSPYKSHTQQKLQIRIRSGEVEELLPEKRSSKPWSLHRAPLPWDMADDTVTPQRDDEQPPRQHHRESFGSTKRFHIAFTSFKLLVVVHFNWQPTEALNHMVLQFYIICEVIYFIALIQVTEPAGSNLIYQYLYIVFGTLGAELLLWTSLSLAMWLVVNMYLLVFALVSFGVFARVSNRLQEIVQPVDDAPAFEVQFDI